MARGRVWQGIRDWFRPVDRSHPSPRPRDLPAEGGSDRARLYGREATRARIDAEGGAEVIPFPGSHVGEAVLDDTAADAELLEFLAADIDPVPADPVFRERLRADLWDMVVHEGIGGRRDDPDR